MTKEEDKTSIAKEAQLRSKRLRSLRTTNVIVAQAATSKALTIDNRIDSITSLRDHGLHRDDKRGR